MSSRSEFTRGATTAFALHVGAMATALGAQLLYARWMTQESFGIYAQATAAMVVAVNLLVIGVPMANLQLLPQFVEKADWARFHGLMRWGMQRVALLSGVFGAAWALGAGILGMEAAWALAGFLLLPTAVIAVQQTQALGFKRVALARGPSEIGRPLFALALFILFVQVGIGASPGVAMVCLLVSSTLTVGILSGRIRQLPPPEASGVLPRVDDHDWQHRSFEFFGHGFFAMVLDRADILVVGWFLGPADAAVYAVVTSLGKLLTFALASVNTIAAPMVSDLHEQGRTSEVRDVLRLGVAVSSVLAVAGVLFLAVFADPVLSLFGEGYAIGVVALWITLIGYAINAMCGSAGLVVSMTGHQAVTWRVVGMAAAGMLALNVVLVPTLGIEGAALCRTAAMAFWNVVLAAYARRALGYDPSLRSWASPRPADG